jgi:predicted Zn-dependent protease
MSAKSEAKKAAAAKLAVNPVVTVTTSLFTDSDFTADYVASKLYTSPFSIVNKASTADITVAIAEQKGIHFSKRNTADKVEMKAYGRAETFTLAIARQIATKGITKDEYIVIANEYGASTKRFAAYIAFYKKQGFNLMLNNDRYIELRAKQEV